MRWTRNVWPATFWPFWGRRSPRQVAALPYRIEGDRLLILLVTSRRTRRWVIPKGNKPLGKTPHRAAAAEAEEEAGVQGTIGTVPLGSYRYRKHRANAPARVIDVDVFPLAVDRQLPRWKESRERERRWFSAAEAATLVGERDLRALIRAFGASDPA